MNYFLTLAITLFLYMNLWFLVSLLRKRNDVADVAWGLGFVLISWTSFLISTDPSVRGLLVGILVSVWGLRLAWHIHARNKGKVEDHRYLAWRKTWGKWFYLRSYVQIYLLQGALLFAVLLPILFINKNPNSTLGILDFVGVAIWIFGFVFEAVGDAQLANFIKNPKHKGKIMQSGLWKYTRHPNYFGEVTQWWGLWFVALSVPSGWLSVLGPMTITFLILKVSGVPMLEKKMAENPAFAEYQKQTSVFVPWFKKNK